MHQVNDAFVLLGRLFLAALFLPSGISKAMGFGAFAASLAAKGLPYSEVWAAAAVAIEVLGPIALILGVVPRWTSLVLIAFVIMATATTHRYWEFADAAARRAQEINFYKNVGIVAGLLFYLVSGAGAWSLVGWRLCRAAPPPAPWKRPAPLWASLRLMDAIATTHIHSPARQGDPDWSTRTRRPGRLQRSAAGGPCSQTLPCTKWGSRRTMLPGSAGSLLAPQVDRR